MWSIASIGALDSSGVLYANRHKEEMRFSSSNRVMAVGNVPESEENGFQRILPFSLL